MDSGSKIICSKCSSILNDSHKDQLDLNIKCTSHFSVCPSCGHIEINTGLYQKSTQ